MTRGEVLRRAISAAQAAESLLKGGGPYEKAQAEILLAQFWLALADTVGGPGAVGS